MPVQSGRRTWCVDTIIDAKPVLEVAERSVRLAVVAQRGAARCDRLLEDGADLRCQAISPRGRTTVGARERRRGAARREAGAVQRLAHVDIAEAGDPRLVEKRGLQGDAAAGEQPREGGAVEGGAKRLEPEAGEQRMSGRARPGAREA